MSKVLGMGEIMVQFNPTEKGSLLYQRMFERHVAGSEANIIIQMQKLDIETSFITAVGSESFGEIILATLREEGVNTDNVKIDENHPTGIYFVQRSYPFPGKTSVIYYRKNSAASKIIPKDLDEKILEDVEMFVVSGITPALGDDVRNSAMKVIDMCKRKGIKVAFDTNIRINLLKTREKAYECLQPFLEKSDIVFTGMGDLSLLFDGEFEEKISQFRKLTKEAELLVIKMGEKGALALNEEKTYKNESFKVSVIDELGAGDAFDGAFLASLLKGYDINEALKYGCAAGAITVSLKGDIEPLPKWKDLELFLDVYSSGESRLLR
ncbi:MAG: sugar kinase [Kosmotogaceae bacterium]